MENKIIDGIWLAKNDTEIADVCLKYDGIMPVGLHNEICERMRGDQCVATLLVSFFVFFAGLILGIFVC